MRATLECYSTNATVAKIRAMHGRMFTADSYRELMTKKSVPECAEYLSRTERYRGAFKDTDPNTIHRGYLEELLNKANFDDYIRLCEFQGLDSIPYYRFLISRREIQCILLMINNINSELENSYLNSLPGYMIRRSKVKLLELSRASTFDELVRILKGTPYYKPLSKIKADPDGKVDYTACELALRRDDFEKLIKYAEDDFIGSEERELKEIIYFEIDSTNIINAYRMKKYFGYSAERIKNSIITVSGRPNGRIQKYYELETPEQMLEWIENSKFGRCDRDTDIIETRIMQARYKWLSHVLAGTTSAPVALYAFVRLCYIEEKNLVHIIEAIRYGADTSALEKDMLIF